MADMLQDMAKNLCDGRPTRMLPMWQRRGPCQGAGRVAAKTRGRHDTCLTSGSVCGCKSLILEL